ncbi:hypothetical protein OROGR_025228 [Orobanche gracilis]
MSSIPWATKKVKLPEFYGFDPQSWLQKASIYFKINGIPPHLRIRLAQLSMSGVATHWFTIVKELYDPLTWDQFQTELLQRFSGLDIHNPYEQLATIKHGESIYNYIDDFENLLSLVPKLPESQSLGYFIGGLNDDVKCWVRLHRPVSRLDAMSLAKDIQQLLHPSAAPSTPTRFRYHQHLAGNYLGSGGPVDPRKFGPNRVELGRSNMSTGSNKVGPATLRVEQSRWPGQIKSSTAVSTDFTNLFNCNRGVRSLPRAEWEERRKKGLCYRCGQQFGPTHKCSEGKLRVLLLADDEQIDDEGLITMIEDMEEDVVPEGISIPEGQCNMLEYFRVF